MSQLCNIDGDQLVLAATAIAIALSRNFKGDDLNILSNLFCSVGDLLAVIAAREACEFHNTQPDNEDQPHDNCAAEPKTGTKKDIPVKTYSDSQTEPGK